MLPETKETPVTTNELMLWRHLVDGEVSWVYLIERGLRVELVSVAYWNFISEFVGKYGIVPSKEVLEEELGQPLPEPVNPVDYCLEYLKRKWAIRNFYMVVDEADKVVEKDPAEAVKLIQTGFSQVELAVARDLRLSDWFAQRKDKSVYKKGLLFPWHSLNKVTGGAKPGDFILLAGRPATGKTWLSCKCAEVFVRQGARVLYFSREMSPEAVELRILSILAGVNYVKLKNSELSVEELHLIKEASANVDLVVTGTRGLGGVRVSDFIAKLDRYSPDVVVADANHLMESETGTQGWEAFRDICRMLKNAILQREVALIDTVQMSREAEARSVGGLGAIAYSDAYGQTTDVVMELVRTDRQRDAGEVALFATKIREGEDHPKFKLSWFKAGIPEFKEIGQIEIVNDGGVDFPFPGEEERDDDETVF